MILYEKEKLIKQLMNINGSEEKTVHPIGITIREIIEKSKLKEPVDAETLQNCIIALNDLVYILKTEPGVKMCYFGLPEEVRDKLLKNMKSIATKCYDNDPVSYSGSDHANPEFWKKMNALGDKLIDKCGGNKS